MTKPSTKTQESDLNSVKFSLREKIRGYLHATTKDKNKKYNDITLRSTLVLPSLILLLAFTATPLPVKGNAQPDPVLDISGKQLRAGSKYYILPVTKVRGGGLTLAGRSNNKTCPLDVVQEQHSFKNGFPVTFSPVNPKKGVVRESTDLNIKFDAATSCAQSTVWKLDNFDAAFGQWLVTTGGVEGNPGPRTMRNWFKIEKFFGDYKLVYCPSVCNFCRGLCRDVGIFINGGVRRLALSDVPFKVVFKKV
ncbi:kunitz trypsin inhibitor 2 [Citrus clementina]|nr:kunitz trypsin inhibitor 2 [Citrus x clementina]